MDISKSLGKDERRPLDVISTLPESVLETILCLLPTKDAARTSILSRDWRHKWTKIPKLDFCLSKMLTQEKQEWEPFYYLLPILLAHQGLIQEITLDMDLEYDIPELDRIILHLSKNHTVKKLKLSGLDDAHWGGNLPISAFSLHHLTDLHLSYFHVNHQPIFIGLDSLTRLSLEYIEITSNSLVHLLSDCPSLKSLTLVTRQPYFSDKCTVIQLFECLPMIEHLTVENWFLESLIVDPVPQDLPPLLFHLKYFCFQSVWYDTDLLLEGFLLVLIKCSPNLEKIKLQECTFVCEEYSDVGLEHLNELEIDVCCYLKFMEFVKLVLARSPKLKKVSIFGVYENEQSEVLETLLQAPRKSNCQIRVTGSNSS